MKLNLLKKLLLVMCLSLICKPSKSNSILDVLLFAAPFAAITATEKVYGWGNSYPEPDFDALSNALVQAQDQDKKLHLYTKGACLPYQTTDKVGYACKQADGTWKLMENQ